MELVTVITGAVVVLAASHPAVLVAGLWWIACAVPLVFIDAKVHRLPDALTLPAAGGVLAVYTIDAVASRQYGHLISALTCAAAAGALFGTISMLLGVRGLGLGDAKLLISVAALLGWWGWGAALGAVFLGFTASALTGVVNGA